MAKERSLPRVRVHLSLRQRQCLQLIAEGLTAGAVALELGISVRMVREHLRCAREKLGGVSTAHAVHLAARQGLLDETA